MSLSLILALVLTVAGVAFWRHEAGRAWLVIGAAAAIFLFPILLLPGFVPSPAAVIGSQPPWQGLTNPAAGNPNLTDVTYQITPWLVFLRDELRQGRLPLWNPYQFAGAPFWANGQGAPLFPLHLLFVLLPLELGFVALAWLRIVVAGMGAWALAREVGARPVGALLAGIAYPLGGMLTSFLLFPMANALCLVPWIWWATERLVSGRGRWWVLAALVTLQGLAGHPETVVHTFLVTAIYLAARSARARVWAALALAWLVGGLVATVQWLPLAHNLLGSSRWQAWARGEPIALGTMLTLPLRLLFPEAHGNPALGTWWGPFNYNATAGFVGVVVLLLAVFGLRRSLLDPRTRGLLAVLLVSFFAVYQLPPVHQILSSTPGLQRMLHHRLLFAVDLSLVLFAAVGWRHFVELERRAAYLAVGAVGGLGLVGWLVYGGEWQRHGLVAQQLRWTVWIAVLAAAIAGLAFLGERTRSLSGGLLLTLALFELCWAHRATNPGLYIDQIYPRTLAIEYLAARPQDRIAAMGTALRPNAAMVYRIKDVRGDDTIKAASYERLYSRFGGANPHYFRPIVDWESPLLDALAVRWVLASPKATSPVEGWRLVYERSDARIFERPSLPLVRWEDGSADGLEVLGSEPGLWRIRARAARRRQLLVAEMWHAGWTASVDGGTAEEALGSSPFLTVEVERGEHEVLLRYRPPLFFFAAAISLGALLILVVAGVVGRR